MVLDFCISFGLAAPLVVGAVLFRAGQRAVAQGRIGPAAATLAYGLCMAALPLGVWRAMGAIASVYLVGNDSSFWASVLEIGLAFLMYAYLCISWALGFVATCLAAWRFTVSANRARQRVAG